MLPKLQSHFYYALCILLLGAVGILPSRAIAQSEIAVFSHMVEAQEEIDSSQIMTEKRLASIERLVRAVRQFKGLKGDKPFTLFVPNNAAFKKVPEGTLAYFTNSDNKKALDELVSFHLLAEKITHEDMLLRIKAGGGKAIFKTMSGFKLSATADPKGNVTLTNESAKDIHITAYNWSKGSGLLHMVDSVIIPFDHGMAEREDANLNLD